MTADEHTEQQGDRELSRFATTLTAAATLANVKLVTGVINLVSGQWQVSSGGQVITAVWAQDIVPWDTAPCLLALATPQTTGTKTPQSIYYLLCVLGAQTSPTLYETGTVTAFTAGAPTCTVTVGTTTGLTANRLSSYTPAVNDTAILKWVGPNLYAIGALAVYTPPAPQPVAPPVAPPPVAPATGNSPFTAQDSGTWTDGYNWNSYYRQNVYSGSGYVPRSTGAWWYNGGTLGLADKTTITGVRIWLGPRTQAGAYNQTQTVHFYTHNQSYRGAGEPTRVDGPYDVAIPPYFGGGWITLPASFGPTLQAGGGISISGDPYIGFSSGPDAPDSGTLSVDWSK